MITSRSDRSKRQQVVEPPGDVDKTILAFLERELPASEIKHAPYLVSVLVKAGARYDRRRAKKKEWMNYSTRRGRFEKITTLAEALVSNLCQLDILSREDLASRVEAEKIESLIGSLRFLSAETGDLAKDVQKSGRPRDLAEERWILELADIYQNAFGKSPRVWGSGSEKVKKRRGTFYHLLEVSRPSSFPRYGKLSLRQVHRTLRLRKVA